MDKENPTPAGPSDLPALPPGAVPTARYGWNIYPNPEDPVDIINLDRGKKIKSFIFFVILYLLVSGGLVWLFVKINVRWSVAVGTVAAMTGYMLLQSYWTRRHMSKGD